MKLSARSSDQELITVISAVRNGEIDDAGIAELALAMAASGKTVRASCPNTADVPSTGGPTSLSTLLCPLFLRALGWTVPKLGVPGRPAGGLDVLSQIPGYRTALSVPDVTRIIENCGYVHFAAGELVAPLDSRLFKLRQQINAQSVPALVIASLLAKKVAVGVSTVGLDVRVASHGNFGSNMPSARENSRRFCRVAELLGINATCILTDGSRPYQPYIGRGESLLALFRLFSGDSDPWLRRHANQCSWISAATVKLPASPASSLPVNQVFAANVNAQGGSMDGFESAARRIARDHQHFICAPASGFPKFDLERIRNTIVSQQRQQSTSILYPDPMGVILVAEEDSPVATGAPVMSVRVERMQENIMSELEACVSISDVPPSIVGEKVDG